MPADVEVIRKLALALPGVVEGVCFGTPAFYVKKKLMLRMWPDGKVLVSRCPLDERAQLMAERPDLFFVTDHYRNYTSILINLVTVDRKTLARMIERAWRLQSERKPAEKFLGGQSMIADLPGKSVETRRTARTPAKAKR